MMLLRIVLFTLAGAAGAALFAGLYQAVGLAAAGADLSALPLSVLLLEVLRLPAFALLGGAVGVVFAPFAPRIDRALAGALRWLPFAALGAVVAPLVRMTLRDGQLPGFSLLVQDYALTGGTVAAALGTGLVCAVAEYLHTRARARRHLARRGVHAGDNDVDEVLKAFWRERAEGYLEGRGQAPEGEDRGRG